MKWWKEGAVNQEQSDRSYLVNVIARANVRISELEARISYLEDLIGVERDV